MIVKKLYFLQNLLDYYELLNVKASWMTIQCMAYTTLRAAGEWVGVVESSTPRWINVLIFEEGGFSWTFLFLIAKASCRSRIFSFLQVKSSAKAWKRE